MINAVRHAVFALDVNLFLTNSLTFTTPWANSADGKSIMFFLLFRLTNFILIFQANCLHWRPYARNVKICFLGKIRKIFYMSSAENLTQHAKRYEANMQLYVKYTENIKSFRTLRALQCVRFESY